MDGVHRVWIQRHCVDQKPPAGKELYRDKPNYSKFLLFISSNPYQNSGQHRWYCVPLVLRIEPETIRQTIPNSHCVLKCVASFVSCYNKLCFLDVFNCVIILFLISTSVWWFLCFFFIFWIPTLTWIYFLITTKSKQSQWQIIHHQLESSSSLSTNVAQIRNSFLWCFL